MVNEGYSTSAHPNPMLKVSLPIAKARLIVRHALGAGRAANMMPLTVVVLDAGGHPVALEREDGSGILRSSPAQPAPDWAQSKL